MEINTLSVYLKRYNLIIPHNLWLKMKLLAFLMSVVLTQVWATGYSQKISLEKRNVSLEAVLKAIERQTKYFFLYDKLDLPPGQKVSLYIHNGSIEETLDRLFAGLPLSYRIFNKNVVVRKEHRRLPIDAQATFQIPAKELEPFPLQTVGGKVTDEKGEGLPGVSILVKGTQLGMISDANGAFSLEVADEKAVLVFSFVGYLSEEVVVGNRTKLEIVLKVDEKALEEVVVIGYGTLTILWATLILLHKPNSRNPEMTITGIPLNSWQLMRGKSGNTDSIS